MTTPLRERTFETDEKLKLPRPFIVRRIHSLLGVWLVLYLVEHLLVNSQAALFFEDDGFGFVSLVNKINALPYLRVVELLFLGVPFLFHGVSGAYYAWTAKLNAHPTDGTKPSLPQYRRNRAYSWERITAWILLFGIAAHVVHMRFILYPAHIQQGEMHNYFVPLKYDRALPLVADKLYTQLYNQAQLDKIDAMLKEKERELHKLEPEHAQETGYIPNDTYYHLKNYIEKEREWLKTAEKKKLSPYEVVAAAPNAGSAFLLIVRETFKNPLMVVLYSILVVASVFHGFNGLWTCAITWGITLTRLSQKRMRTLTTLLMGVVMLLGLMAAWGTYWTIQFQ